MRERKDGIYMTEREFDYYLQEFPIVHDSPPVVSHKEFCLHTESFKNPGDPHTSYMHWYFKNGNKGSKPIFILTPSMEAAM